MTGIAAFVGLAEAMADAVRPIVIEHFRRGVDFGRKRDASPVTIADREAEAAMRAMIGAAFPDHGVLGEEEAPVRLDARYLWVLDPIDGTKSFVTGKPLFGTLIALLDCGQPIVGIIDMPALDERWIGAKGRATLRNGEPVRVRARADLANAWLYATSPQMFRGDDAAAFERLRLGCYVALYGADCYAYALLASGRVDLVCEASLQPFDYCALVPVIQGAGGVITDWHGLALGPQSDGRVLAAGDPAIHLAARQLLAA